MDSPEPPDGEIKPGGEKPPDGEGRPGGGRPPGGENNAAGEKPPDGERKRARPGMQELKLLALVSSVGLAMVLSVAFGVLLGLWLDRRLGTKPWLFFAGLAVGVAAAFKNFVVMTRRMERQRSEVYGKGKPPGGE